MAGGRTSCRVPNFDDISDTMATDQAVTHLYTFVPQFVNISLCMALLRACFWDAQVLGSPWRVKVPDGAAKPLRQRHHRPISPAV